MSTTCQDVDCLRQHPDGWPGAHSDVADAALADVSARADVAVDMVASDGVGVFTSDGRRVPDEDDLRLYLLIRKLLRPDGSVFLRDEAEAKASLIESTIPWIARPREIGLEVYYERSAAAATMALVDCRRSGLAEPFTSWTVMSHQRYAMDGVLWGAPTISPTRRSADEARAELRKRRRAARGLTVLDDGGLEFLTWPHDTDPETATMRTRVWHMTEPPADDHLSITGAYT